MPVFGKTTKIENKNKNKRTKTKTKRKKTKTKEQRDVYGVIAYSFRHDQYPIHRLCVATSVYILQRLFMYSHLESNSWIYQINCSANMHNPYVVQVSAMQEAGFWILRSPEYFFTEIFLSLSFLTSNYDCVHVKNICKMCIVKISAVSNFWLSVIAVTHNELLFLLIRAYEIQ